MERNVWIFIICLASCSLIIEAADQNLTLCELFNNNSNVFNCSTNCAISSQLFCNGEYNCVDRSDETWDFCKKKSKSSEEQPPPDIYGLETTLAAIIFLLAGVPMVWILKSRFVTCLLKCFQIQQQQDLPLNNTLLKKDDKVIEFIVKLVKHIEEGTDNDGFLLEDYRIIHDCQEWSGCTDLLVEIGNLFFDARIQLIDRYHTVIHGLEKSLHGDEKSTDLCLKNKFGNRAVAKILWSSDPPAIRKLYKVIIPERVSLCIKSQRFKKLSTYVGLVLETLAYYLDFVKDWCVFVVVLQYVGPFQQRGIESHILILMALFLVLPEILVGFYFASHYKQILDIRHAHISTLGQFVAKATIVLCSPLVPAVLLIERCAIMYRNLGTQAEIFGAVDKMISGKSEKSENLRLAIEKYRRSLQQNFGILKMVTVSKHVEMTCETFYQFLLQIIIVLVARNSHMASVHVAEGMDKIFYNQMGTLLYISILYAFITLISTRVSVESWTKMGYFPDVAKITFGCHTLLALTAKAVAVVAYFAPVLDLFGLSVHWKMGHVPFASDIKGWQPSETSAPVNRSTLYLIFLFGLMPAQWFILFAIKYYLVAPFRHANSWARRAIHVANCILFPGIYQDWDSKKNKDLESMSKLWHNLVKYEHVFMVIWHAFVNLTYCIPLMYTVSHNVMARHNLLHQVGFPPTQDEIVAKNSALIMATLVPFTLAIVIPLLQWLVLYLYYKFGHPWCRLFRHI